ncbi:MAG: FemAB family PEP-CTERM system-associated protein [Planctomycetota bacterium]|nr:FemAB family PEP-CTERM system-associated protein [Planctomycetota bacterium]
MKASKSEASEFEVVPFEESWRDRWDAYVIAHENSSYSHLRAWADVLMNSLGHGCESLLAKEGEQVCGVLPLYHVKSLLFGRALVSAPAANACGILADNGEVMQQLIKSAGEKRRQLGCLYVEFRQEGTALEGLPAKDEYLTTVVSLEEESENVRKRISKKIKRDFNRSKRDGLTVENGHEYLDDFYAQYGAHMHRLGSPQFSKQFFWAIVDAYGDKAEVVVVRQNSRTVAGNIAIHHRGRINNLYAGAEPDAMKSGAVSLFCWEQIERGCHNGMREYDLGRSTAGSNSHEYKKYWHGEDVPYRYAYILGDGEPLPDKETNSMRFQLASKAWRKMPKFLAEWLGPRIVRALH